MSDHERVVLGSLMLNSTLLDDVADILTGTEFYEPKHELIYAAIVAQAQAGKPTDPVALGDALGDDLKRIGGRAYLHDLVAAVSVADSVAYYAQRVREALYLRTVREAGIQLQSLPDHADDPLEAVNEARERLDALTVDDVREVPHDAAVYEAIESLEHPVGMKTPWRGLDRAISGWSPGWLYIVGARPAVGKTVIGVGVALDCARRGKHAVLVSMEMPKNDLYLRMLSSVGSIDGTRILHRSLNDRDYTKMADAAKHVSGLPMTVDDRSSLSLAQIRAKVRKAQRKADVGVVVVDYLGLIAPPKGTSRDDRRVQVDRIAQGLKDLARDLKVPVVALAQLNRGVEGRVHKEPTLSDLRESGQIEAAADVVLLLHRDQDNTPETLEIHIRKNRHGEMGMFRLDFRGEYSRAEDPIGAAPLRAV